MAVGQSVGVRLVPSGAISAARTLTAPDQTFAPFGEAFYVPYFHKDHGPTWNMLIEAKPGSHLDRFGDCKSGERAVEFYKQVIKEVIPWDYDWAKDMELAVESIIAQS
jgi:Styrene monooxygenase A putative substrate binding domain